MKTRQALFDPVAVLGNMGCGVGAQCLRGGNAGIVVLPHLLCGEVRVCPGAVPVTPALAWGQAWR